MKELFPRVNMNDCKMATLINAFLKTEKTGLFTYVKLRHSQPLAGKVIVVADVCLTCYRSCCHLSVKVSNVKFKVIRCKRLQNCCIGCALQGDRF